MRRLAFALLLLLAACGRPAPSQDRDTWYVIRVNGQPAGYSRETRSTKDGAHRTETVSDMRVGRFGQATRMLEETSWEEKADGTPLRYRYRALLSANETVQTGEVKDTKLEIAMRSTGAEEKKTVAWSAQWLFPARAEAFQREKGRAPGTSYTYTAWNPGLGRAVAHAVKVGAREKVVVAGAEYELTRVEVKMDIAGIDESVQWVDADGRVLKSLIKMMKQTIEQELADRAAALRATTGDVPELLANTCVKPANMPRDLRRVARAVYKLTIKEGDVRPEGLRWDGQTVDKVDGRALTITVDPPRPPDSGVPTLPVDRADMADFLKETTILECHNKNVVAAAKDAVGGETDAWRAAKKIEAWVRSHITKKTFGVAFATAAEVAARLEGDCTEHSVLAAAMARAVGLPSRVAVGLVAVGDLYGGHMWTEVWVGRWVPLEPTIAGDIFDATHIKMGESAGSGTGLQEDLINMLLYLGRIELEILETK